MLTFEELLEKDNSFTIHHKNLQKLATEMYKVRNNISPPNIRNLFNEQTHKYSLRKEKIWENSNVHTVQWGIETITYVLRGTVKHADSLGNKGLLSDGDLQWMTAGSGIIHQEMLQEAQFQCTIGQKMV